MWLRSSFIQDLRNDISAHLYPLELSINDIFLRLWRASAKVTLRGPLSDWIAQQNCLPKMYLQYVGSGDSHVALGSLFQTEEFPKIRIVKNPYGFTPKLYGGSANAHTSGQLSIWQNFPRTIFFLPEIEMETVGKECFVTLYFLNNAEIHTKEIIQRVSKLLECSSAEHSIDLTATSRKDFPTRRSWNRIIENLVKDISLGKIEKAVVARQSSFTYEQPLSISYLLRHLQKIPRSTVFGIQFSPLATFIGVTPELLYSRKKETLEVMALAGTSSALQSRDLQGEKEQKEFGFVKEFIYKKMKTLCRTIEFSPDVAYPIASLVHLCRMYRGKLFPFINDQEILKTLHPTPAISGFPREAAAHFLQQTEPFDRGWYASPIGYVSEKETRIYIALRSALVSKNNLHLFSGAGIVKGSIAEKEWEELDKKIGHFF